MSEKLPDWEIVLRDSITPPAWLHGDAEIQDKPVRPINWNRPHDPKDVEVWSRMVQNFWIPEKVNLASDIKSWNAMTRDEQVMVMRVFTGLTVLDTIQATVGEPLQVFDEEYDAAQQCYDMIAVQQAIHAKSYSSVFSTLCNTPDIDAAYRWAIENPVLQKRAKMILEVYRDNDPIKRKIASCMISSFLLYAGFYLPLYLSVRGTLTNTADMVRLILRDKAIHGYYGGYKYQRKVEKLSKEQQEYYKNFTYEYLEELYELEMEYSSELFEPFGLMEDCAGFIRYNASKALANLGLDPLFPDEDCQFSAEVFSALTPGSDESNDFFSGSGSSYILGLVEDTEDEDWEF